MSINIFLILFKVKLSLESLSQQITFLCNANFLGYNLYFPTSRLAMKYLNTQIYVCLGAILEVVSIMLLKS